MLLQLPPLLLALQQLYTTGTALPTEQKPLKPATLDSVQAVRAELRKAEIIPTVIDDFLPSLTLQVSWTKENADLGNTIEPKRLQDQPSISLYDETTPDGCASNNVTYVVTLTDPDAPSRDDPKWSEMCHWIASNVSLSQRTFSNFPAPLLGPQESKETQSAPEDVIEYKPPGPPPKTGKHRYVFLVFAPANGTTLPLDLSKPKDRQHWGTGEEGGGVRNWAEDNGLVPVAANFIYSQNKKQ